MKQYVHLYIWLTGLAMLLSPGLLAQTDSSKPKSRLEMGGKPVSNRRVIHSGNFPFLKHPTVSSLDRSVQLQKNSAVNQYYRDQLLSNPTAKAPARTVAETTAAPAAEARVATEKAYESRGQEEYMYVSDKAVVRNIYPNPASTTEGAVIDYQLLGSTKDAKILVYNVLGSQVGEYVLDCNEQKVRINTHNMNGVYLYQLALEGQKVATKKLLVNRQ